MKFFSPYISIHSYNQYAYIDLNFLLQYTNPLLNNSDIYVLFSVTVSFKWISDGLREL